MKIETKYTLAEAAKKATEKLRNACLEGDAGLTAIGWDWDGKIIAEYCNIMGLVLETEMVSVLYFGPEDEDKWFGEDWEQDEDSGIVTKTWNFPEYWDDDEMASCEEMFYCNEGRRNGGGYVEGEWEPEAEDDFIEIVFAGDRGNEKNTQIRQHE